MLIRTFRLWNFLRVIFGTFIALVSLSLLAFHTALPRNINYGYEYFASRISSQVSRPPPLEFEDVDIPKECLCKDKTNDIGYNFCYSLPTNRTKFGKKFDCSFLQLAKRLGIIDRSGYVKLEQGNFPEPVFATGASSSHFGEQLRYIATLQKFLPKAKIVFYDLGLFPDQIPRIRSLCQVEYRKFLFEDYPSYVRKLNHYRWKPIIIAAALKEFGAIWWGDSSVVWKKNDLSHVYSLVTCKNNETKIRLPDDFEEPKYDRNTFVESGWHVDQWMASVSKCDKFPYMLQGFTGHGIFPATDPGVYRYIPTDDDSIKLETAKMYEAGFVFAVRTATVMRDVLKWYVLCALEKDCMAPQGSTLGCGFAPKDRYATYAHCHRYDQSVVNLLLANKNHFDKYYYTSGIVDFFNIVRGGGEDNSPQICPLPSPKNS